MPSPHHAFMSRLNHIREYHIYGTVISVKGLMIECTGIHTLVSVGSRCMIYSRHDSSVIAEVVGVEDKRVLLMPYNEPDGIGVGCQVEVIQSKSAIFPDDSWRGRVINAFAEAIDEKETLLQGEQEYILKNSPPPAHQRNRVGGKVDLGVRAINSFITCCKGQRLGIFAGSGVGKSMLISSLTKYSDADVKVIGLIGERGREVQEFIQEYLGEEGLKQAVIIVATSDESALTRVQAAYTTMAVAEYFRDQGNNVLCLMDSVTRFAMAYREIGLSVGEPPASKGYTPRVFSELPKLLERAGPGTGEGNITGLFSVLVEGDDTNEPIADAVRGILDGHIVLDRKIAERGRFPAINILRSVSRTMPACNSEEENLLVNKARRLLSTYDDMEDMIRLGAYRKGSDPTVDEAIHYFTKIDEFLAQSPSESSTIQQGYDQLAEILGATKQAETKE